MMKKGLLVSISIALIWIVSCSSPENKLIGTWKVKNVETNFDEQSVSPEMLSQIIEIQKQTYFRIVNDSIMAIISVDNTHEAKWILDPEDNTITFFFEGMETMPNKLGVYNKPTIIAESNTPLGKMITYYEKE